MPVAVIEMMWMTDGVHESLDYEMGLGAMDLQDLDTGLGLVVSSRWREQ